MSETRTRILQLLKMRATLTVKQLAEALHISHMGIRQHLAILETEGLVEYCIEKQHRGLADQGPGECDALLLAAAQATGRCAQPLFQGREQVEHEGEPPSGGLPAAGERALPVMGCYGIGLGRLLAAVVQANHDGQGIVWPPAVAPYDVHIVAIGAERPEIAAALERLEADLEAAGLSCLSDDRDERPGVKFNDADLIGVPLRITLGPRGLRGGRVELKPRAQAQARDIALEAAASVAQDALAALDA